ncbi:BgTH12-04836 [Blumeria graminis f. sp. triticale]|uniref:Bgt-1466 n=3 Tax=Blumeria graminis TaxID=34373 RepID=A0A061HFN8_BLUGR|nr:hypothetical protein BGT96224_1466 [Blumeria graminis f. sp. tritici 96224]CAD6499184.1 BgTH12-04836 [Blumeria graminis f. sp. triticale]VCU39301.1 Bgt-1466 [Blumeria graminis f. sp. tritici]
MARSRRNLSATAELTSSPPVELSETQSIARVIKAEGNNLYSCSLSGGGDTLLVELPSCFRNTIWLKRNGFVLIDTKEADVRHNKIGGKIINVVLDERVWRKLPYWPKDFVKAPKNFSDSDAEESTVGKLPPSDSENENEFQE